MREKWGVVANGHLMYWPTQTHRCQEWVGKWGLVPEIQAMSAKQKFKRARNFRKVTAWSFYRACRATSSSPWRTITTQSATHLYALWPKLCTTSRSFQAFLAFHNHVLVPLLLFCVPPNRQRCRNWLTGGALQCMYVTAWWGFIVS
jgi:hypothetical protein